MKMHKHTKIKQYLLAEIEKGNLMPGDKLETEENIAKRFEVSRPTVRQALKDLEQEGYLSRVKGSGTFVTEPKVLHTSTSFIASYKKEAEEQGRAFVNEVVEFETIAANEKIARELGIKKGMQVKKLVRIRKNKGGSNEEIPVVYTSVYIPLFRFPEIDTQDFSKVSLYETLEKYGMSICHVSKILEVCMPAQEVRDALRIGAWEPTIFVASKGFLKNGEIMEYAESYYPAGRSKFLIELKR